ncbi:hypothetical protein MVEN_01666300 [Mycena venus]|uniref:Uncharacterized protein n=1 Tax=Mycena venus TaxID=2733690 RepID=A0A8H6XRJ6_9AGAR|nr:hypothetical protein MVEN_01666300 [Mycena venus]
MISRPSLIALYALAQALACLSTITNRTIDDFSGDAVTGALPTYSPPNKWNVVVNSNCTTCYAQPDASRAVDHSWHDTTVPAGLTYAVTLKFTGTAIYFFGIVPNTIPNTQTFVNLTFTLDGSFTGAYTHVPDKTSTQILYSVPMLAKEGLSNDAHVLVAEVQSASLLLFDSATYTFDDGKPDAPPVSPVSGPSAVIPPPSSTSKSTALIGPSTSGAVSSVPVGISGSSTASSLSTGTSSGTSSLPTTNTVQVIPTASGVSGQDNTNQTVTGGGASAAASSGSHFPVAIVAGAVGGAVIVALLAFAIVWFRRRRYHTLPRIEAFPSQISQSSPTSPYSRPETRESSFLQNSTHPSYSTREVSYLQGSTQPSYSRPDTRASDYPENSTQAPLSPVGTSTALPPYTPRDPPENNSTTSLLTGKSHYNGT